MSVSVPDPATRPRYLLCGAMNLAVSGAPFIPAIGPCAAARQQSGACLSLLQFLLQHFA